MVKIALIYEERRKNTMATLASAKAKYARKTGPGSAAVSAYNAAKGRMVQNYSSGVARFLGGAPAAHVVASYQAGVSAAQYNGGDPNLIGVMLGMT